MPFTSSLIYLALSFTSLVIDAGQNPLDAATQKELNEMILDYHNYMRSRAALGVVDGNGAKQPSGSNMVNLEWSDGLAEVAQTYANKCVYEHNAARSDDTYTIISADRSGHPFAMDSTTMAVGENIGYSTVNDAFSVTMDGLQAMWTEAEFYTVDGNVCEGSEPCGHYTQMAWANTRYIGCGVAECSSLGGDGPPNDGFGMFFVCNYYPSGNVNVNNQLSDIYDYEDEPCANCPWDKSRCTYDSSADYTYNPSWVHVRDEVTDIYSAAGLCVGCGNKYYAQCNRGANLEQNCKEENIATAGCDTENGAAECDAIADAANGFPDANVCRVNDYCRKWCGFCYCNIPSADSDDYEQFNTCDESSDGCSDGLGRSFTGGCWNGEGASYWDDWCEDNLDSFDEDDNVKESASADVSWCFASDSYVLTYPNYERRQLSEVELFDKILIYDELSDEYVWDDLMVKLHFESGEFLNGELVPMREFVLEGNGSLAMTDNHLLYVNGKGLQRADSVKIGDSLRQFEGGYVRVNEVNEVMKYPRNMISYNGNLVINGIAISTFTDTIYGESEYWGKAIRFVMKHFYKRNVWRYPAYYTAKWWNEWLTFEGREAWLKFYFGEGNEDKESSCWHSALTGMVSL